MKRRKKEGDITCRLLFSLMFKSSTLSSMCFLCWFSSLTVSIISLMALTSYYKLLEGKREGTRSPTNNTLVV
jgi:hypothetical protein